MGHMHDISTILRNFETSVLPNLSSMESAKSDICTYLTDSKSGFDSALNGISQGWKDSNGQSVQSAITLIMDASERLSTSMSADLGNILSRCSEVGNIITEINQKISEGSKLTPSGWEKIWNAITRIWSNKYCENDQGKIDQLNDEIDQLNKQGEAMLNAISGAAGGISLGIAGNMTNGGSLGAYTDFASNYKFNSAEWLAANPIRRPSVLSSVGCGVVGTVGSVVKLGEGLIDAGATVAAEVISFFGGDSSGIVEFIKKDHVGDFIEDTLGNWSGYNPDALSVGKGVGDAAIIGVTNVISAIPILGTAVRGIVSVGMGGEASETVLESTDDLGLATAAGTATGVATFFLTGLGKGSKAADTQNIIKPTKPNNPTRIQLPGSEKLALPPGSETLTLPSGSSGSSGSLPLKILDTKNGFTLYENGHVFDPNGKFYGALNPNELAKYLKK